MRISIITPTYNSEKYIASTLDSIHSQGYDDLEHIVIDGNSKDRTLEIVREYPEVKYISEKDEGQSDAINKGFRMISGDIVAWQNADDLYEADTFRFVSNLFNDNPDVGLVYGAYHEIDQFGIRLCTVNAKPWSHRRFKHGRFCPVQPTVFWRKSLLDEVGFLDLNLNYCMDVDFYSRAVNLGFNFLGVEKVLGSFRVHDQSKTQNTGNRVAHKKEYLKVLSERFNYAAIDRVIFEYFYHRSLFASKVKRRLGL